MEPLIHGESLLYQIYPILDWIWAHLMVVVVLVVVVVVEVMPMDDKIKVPLFPRIKPGEMHGIAPEELLYK